MNRVLLVMSNEVQVTVRRRSFLFLAVGLPVLSFFLISVVGTLNRSAPETLSGLVSPSQERLPEGYVDQSGLIVQLPQGVEPGDFRPFRNADDAEAALAAGEISGYYVVPEDYLETGQLLNIRPDFNPLDAFGDSNRMTWILQVSMLEGDVSLAGRINEPLLVDEISLSPDPQRDENNPLTFFIPYVVALLFYIVILMSSSYLLNSITKEKENRVIEILMVSIPARVLMVGKFLGLGLVGIIQTLIWAGTGLVILRLSGRSFSLPEDLQLNPEILFFGLVYFLLGYALYGSLLAGVGALVPNLREASQATFFVLMPMFLPLILISVIIEDPNGTLATFMSIFPFTAPVTMMTRLAAGPVPGWQLVLSLAITGLTSVLILRAVAGLFRTQTILSGQPFNMRRFVAALVTRG